MEIGIAGSGWGFWAAANSLTRNFNAIEVFNADEPELLHAYQLQHPEITFRVVGDISNFLSRNIICAGLRNIIPNSLLSVKTFINIHYSLLPDYRGLHSTVWAILNNEKFLGYTVHLINEFIDDGPIIYQHRVANDFSSTSKYYMELFNKHVEENLGNLINRFLNQQITPEPQDKRKASWVGKRNLHDCQISFNSTSEELKAFFRALSEPYPTPYFVKNKKLFFPRKASFQKSRVKTHIGRVLNIDSEGVWIKIQDGYIILDEIQAEDGQVIANDTFKLGTRLDDSNKTI
ncbi:MAG: hypothetical protein K0S09_3167 [Sphingobacteriaceae bacterium]|jgi:methionyl-tRNA formyltransferase|nr:hypothetical protein [Sphingobacteriaceae bacterium]